MHKKGCLVLLAVLLVAGWSGCGTTAGQPARLHRSAEAVHVDDILEYPDSPLGPLSVLALAENRHFVRVLDIGDRALLARVHLARVAQRTIDIQTFIWEDDACGRLMLVELVAAARRGVRVRILLDQMAQNLDPQTVADLSLASPNIHIRFYNPNIKKVDPNKIFLLKGVLDIKRLNQRMHNKIMVVDDRFGITGGRNYQDDYFDRGTERNFKDRDVLVVGPVARDMTDSFQDYWVSDLSVDSTDMVDVQARVGTAGRFDAGPRADDRPGPGFSALEQCAQDAGCLSQVFGEGMFAVTDPVVFFSDAPGKNGRKGLGGGGAATAVLADLIRQARNEIVLQTPYLVLDRPMRAFFKRVRRDQPQLDILVSTNSLAAADHDYAYAFAYKNKRFYVKDLRWRIFEFKRPPADADQMLPPIAGVTRTRNYFACIHSKSMVIDRKIVYIGSFNVDPRSANLNTECGLVIYDAAVAEAVRADIERDMAPQNSWTVGKKRDLPLMLSRLNTLMATISHWIPFVDVWPLAYAESFELRAGQEPVPFDHAEFYERYRSVGPFPGLPLTSKEIKARLIKGFFGSMEPMI